MITRPGEVAEELCDYSSIYANSYCLYTSSVSPSASHLPQRGRLFTNGNSIHIPTAAHIALTSKEG